VRAWVGERDLKDAAQQDSNRAGRDPEEEVAAGSFSIERMELDR
jgi:hypothetical protein